MSMDYVSLRERLQKELGAKRLAHVYGCKEESERLAEKWGADKRWAGDAALLHDLTKELKSADQLKLCKKFGIVPNQAEQRAPGLLHAATAAEIARREYHQPDEVVLAIRYHTTGRAGMTLLEKILFVADFIEPTRTFEHDELTRLAYSDLDAAVLYGLSWSVKEVIDKQVLLHPDTVEGYNSLLRGGEKI